MLLMLEGLGYVCRKGVKIDVEYRGISWLKVYSQSCIDIKKIFYKCFLTYSLRICELTVLINESLTGNQTYVRAQ